MHRPDKGTILFKGEDITGLRSFERIRRGISVKFQVPGIFTALPVRQNLEIAFQNHLHGHRLDATIRRVLDFTGLGPEAARPAGTLSHGQKQWLEIGMAVGVEPRPAAARRADGRHVAGGDRAHRRDAARPERARASPSSRSSTT